MSSWPRQVTALAACAVVLLGAGCGSDDEQPGPGVPREVADRLDTELDLVQRRLDVTRDEGKIGSCNDIEVKSYRDIGQLIDGLPPDTDRDVRRALVKSVDRLKRLTEAECSDLEQEIRDRKEETTPQVTTPPPPPPQETVPQPTQTVPQPEQKKEKKQKDEQNQGEGNGQGGTAPPEQDAGGQPAPLPEEE